MPEMRLCTTIHVVAGCAALAVASSAAYAENPKAEELFRQAKKLMAEQRYADACPKFEASFDLDPGIGGELNIARCYEEWGKLGRAYRAYVDAEQQAKNAGDARAPKIRELVAKLEPQVPRLVIKVPKSPEFEDVRISVDGMVVSKADLARPYLVDPGPKQIEYALANGTRQTLLIPIERGATKEITLELPRDGKTAKDAKESPPAGSRTKSGKDRFADDRGRRRRPGDDLGKANTVDASPPGRNMRIAGIVTGSAGVVAIGVSTVLALSARSKYNDALKSHCQGVKDACDLQGLTDTRNARSLANVATIVFSAGLAATVGGIALYIAAPRGEKRKQNAYYLVPEVSPEGGGVAFGGRF